MAEGKTAWIYVELTTSQQDGELQFQVERKFGSFFLRIYPAICFVLMILCSAVALTEEYPPDWSVGIGIGAAFNLVALPIIIFFARKNRMTKLSVTRLQLTASGRGVGMSPWRSATITVPVAEYDWVGYVPGDVPGLYLSRGLIDSKCILPGLTREQAGSVTDAIVRRFPELRAKFEPKR